jgi:hypothetical protein
MGALRSRAPSQQGQMSHHRSPSCCELATIDILRLCPTNLKRNDTGAADDFGLPNSLTIRAKLIR